jgi:mannose-1-phosphate guanylyltransferase
MEDAMKAVLLAAGKSSRLGELGAHTPKPMLPLEGRPILEWTVDRLRRSGIQDLLINLHHVPEVIPNYFGDGSAFDVRITYQHEPEILGTAGAIREARSFLGTEPFLVVYADNVLDWDPAALIESHRAGAALATISVAQIQDPSRSGVVQFDENGTILAFHEKPGRRPELGNWVNAAVYALDPRIFDYIPTGFADFGFDVFPMALAAGEKLQVHLMEAAPFAVDTPDQYAVAQRRWQTSAALRGPAVDGFRTA